MCIRDSFRSIKNVGAQSTNCKRKTVKELKEIQKFWPKNYNNTVNLSWQIEIQMSISNSIFKFIICGTDTDIGKTLISSFFVRGLNSFYWKPIQSGIESQTDSQTVEKLAQVSKEKIIKEAYIFTKPLSPHWAAEIDPVSYTHLTLPTIAKV